MRAHSRESQNSVTSVTALSGTDLSDDATTIGASRHPKHNVIVRYVLFQDKQRTEPTEVKQSDNTPGLVLTIGNSENSRRQVGISARSASEGRRRSAATRG